jgi:hypothetical protein
MLTYCAVPTLYMMTYKPRAPTWGDAGADWGFELFESIPNGSCFALFGAGRAGFHKYHFLGRY